MTSQDDDNTVHVSMRMKFNFFLYNKLSVFNLNILVVKDGSHLASESWSSCGSVMAASLVAHMLNEPRVFHSWPHYQGNHAIIKCCHILASDLLNLLLGSFHSTVTDKLHGTCSLCGVCHPKFSCPTLTTCSSCLS